MPKYSNALIDLSSGNKTLLFIIFGVFIIAFIAQTLIIKSKSKLGQTLIIQNTWQRKRHFIRFIKSIVGMVFILVGLIFIIDRGMDGSDNYPIFFIGAIVAIVLLIAVVTNWVGYKSLK